MMVVVVVGGDGSGPTRNKKVVLKGNGRDVSVRRWTALAPVVEEEEGEIEIGKGRGLEGLLALALKVCWEVELLYLVVFGGRVRCCSQCMALYRSTYLGAIQRINDRRCRDREQRHCVDVALFFFPGRVLFVQR